jgi:ubiquinone/menaquinone biosynthesis C-methylase UbiE
MKYWFKFYLYSIFLGLRTLVLNFKNSNREVIKRIIIPMDIARYFEIPYTHHFLNLKKGEKIFDLSSPKLISFYLAEVNKVTIVATDIWKEEVASWKVFKNSRWGKSIFKKLKLVVADGRKIGYPKNYFDKAYSISVIEHIEGNGDTKTIKELARIIKPGGCVVITTPLGNKYQEIWVKRNAYSIAFKGEKPVFLSRIYSPKALRDRLIKPSGLKLEKQIICQEKHPLITTLYTKLFPVSILFGLSFPLFALLNLTVSKRIGKKNNTLFVLRKS